MTTFLFKRKKAPIQSLESGQDTVQKEENTDTAMVAQILEVLHLSRICKYILPI